MFSYKLDCGHTIYTEVELRNQYPTDEHFILCPSCREAKLDDYVRVPTAWRNVVGGQQFHDNLHHVFRRDEIIMPDRIMRIQPSVPKHRVRPFPYVNRVRR